MTSSDYDATRPEFHFTPLSGWINDPNGLVFDGKKYHLFAQHHPHGLVWGPMHWLHAISNDLLKWQELGIALYPDELGTIFSGSAVIDTDNSAGFGHNAMVAIYTQHGAVECQSIAYSTDRESFIIFDGNPVIQNPGISDFRDPKVFWFAKEQHWVMVLAAKDHIEFYRSNNLINWTKTGSFGKDARHYGDLFECPDLFELQTEEGSGIWVLLVSMGAKTVDGGARMQYYLGQFDGSTFVGLEEPAQGRFLDAGFDNYAGVTYNGTNERIYLGWAASPVYAGKVPASDYRGCMTLPRRLSLVNTDYGASLAFNPMISGRPLGRLFDGAKLADGAYELQVQASSSFEITLLNSSGEKVFLALDELNCINVDRTGAGESSFCEYFSSKLFSTTRKERLLSGDINMRIIVDHTIIEVFADQGTYVHTLLLFPKSPFTTLRIEGSAIVNMLQLE